MAEVEAAVAILHARFPADSILLMRRAEREDDPWSGHWSFPGGRRDPEDADLLHTALRELVEECSVALERTHLERALAPRTARRRTGPFLEVAPFVFSVESELDAVPDLNEAVEARWVALDVLRDPAQHRLLPIPGLPLNMLFPCVPLDEMPLWGFTYRLITDWLGLVPPGASGARWAEQSVGGCASIVDAARRLEGPHDAVPPVNMVEITPDGLRVSEIDFSERWVGLDGRSLGSP